MGTLFIIGSASESTTIFEITRKIKERGGRVILVFRGDGIRFLDHPNLWEANFETYILEGEGRRTSTHPARIITPQELAELMETCERIVSWV